MWAYEVTLAPNVVNNGGKKHPQEQNSHLRQVTIWGGTAGRQRVSSLLLLL